MYKYTQQDRPDKADVKLLRQFTKKKVQLQKSVDAVKHPQTTHMFQTSPEGLPEQGVTTGQYVHITWDCGVTSKTYPNEGCSPRDLLMVAIARLQYLQQNTVLSHPRNYEALMHLYNAVVLLSNDIKGNGEDLGLVDLHKVYA